MNLTLLIDTSDNKNILLSLERDDQWLAEIIIKARFKQSERLLPNIDKLIRKNGFELSDIKAIKVKDIGSSFTSLRIGIVTANTLAYALGVILNSGQKNVKIGKIQKSGQNLSIVRPKYSSEANITVEKNQDF